MRQFSEGSSEALSYTLGACMVLGMATAPAAAQSVPLSATTAELAGPAPQGPSAVQRSHPRLTLNPEALKAGKLAAEREYRAAFFGPPAPGEPEAAVFSGLNKPGVNATASSSTPPDTTGSIGPAHYVEFTNGGVAAFSRAALAMVSSASLDTLTARAGSCDPQIQWDKGSNRWLYAAIDCSGNSSKFALLLGWSKTTDPTNFNTGWCKFFVDTSSTGTNTGLSDYPKLGHSMTFGIIGTNDFAGGTSFSTARIWIYAKPAAGVTTCSAPTVFHTTGTLTNPDGTQTFTPVPANEADNPVNGYITAAHFAPASKILLLHVAGTPTAPTLTTDGDVTVPAFAFPANVPQPGTSATIDSSDTRLTQSVGRTDSAIGAEAIWTQHTINGTGGRSVVRWYEINTKTKTLRQRGTVASGTLFVFNGAISPTNAGTSAAAIFANRGSATAKVSLIAQSRVATSPLNQMPRPVASLGNSLAIDLDFSCSPCRWGDYAGASPDLTNNNLVWGSNQLNGAATGHAQWITRNFAVKP